jgi:Fic family protein
VRAFVPHALADMQGFIQDTATDLPPLVKVALIHAQFETI